MFNKNIRLISKEELDKVNPLLNRRFGTMNQIASGSCEVHEGKNRYHISLMDFDTYKPKPFLLKIGNVVKDVFGADEVYLMGVQIA